MMPWKRASPGAASAFLTWKLLWAMNSSLASPLGSKGRWLQMVRESQVSPFCSKFIPPDRCWCIWAWTMSVCDLWVKCFRDDLFPYV